MIKTQEELLDAEPPAMTPAQLIQLLEELVTTRHCEKRLIRGRRAYLLSADEVYEAAETLRGAIRKKRR